MNKITESRQAELIEMATEQLNDNGDWFDYHNWDGLIECDEALTADELDWMRDNLTVTVTVTKEA
jgi:hypothetical protein